MAEYYVKGSQVATGTATAGDATTITLAEDSSAVDDFYNGYGISILSGTGNSKSSRRITDYDGTTRVATINSAWETNPDNTSVYIITLGADPNDGTVNTKFDGTHGAYATIQYALSQMATGDTVQVADATYNEPRYAYLYLGLLADNGKTLNIVGESKAGTIIAKYAYAPADRTTATIYNFSNLTIAPAGSGNHTLRWDANITKVNVNFVGCNVYQTSHATKGSLVSMVNSTGTPDRSVSFDDCDLYCPGASYPMFSITDVLNFTLKNSRVHSCFEECVKIAGDVGSITISNNEITGTGTNCDLAPLGSLNSVSGTIWIYGNTATGLRNGIQVIIATTPTIPIVVVDNDISCTNTVAGFIYSFGSDNTPDETAVYITAMYSQLYFAGNKGRNIGSNACHAALIGGDVIGASVIGNDLHGTDYGLVAKGSRLHILYNKIQGVNTLYLSGSTGSLVRYNSCKATAGYALSWGNNSGQGTARLPKNNIVEYNIFDASASTGTTVGAITLGGVIADTYGQIINRNVYVNGTAGLVKFNGTAYPTFAALHAAQTYHDMVGNNNDADSLIVNPQLDSEFRVHNSDLWAGEYGAWQPTFPTSAVGARALRNRTRVTHSEIGL